KVWDSHPRPRCARKPARVRCKHSRVTGVKNAMKQWIALAVVAPALLLGAAKETCPFGPFDLRSPREQQAGLYHQLSVTAEAVAPTGRHRAVQPPPRGTTVYPASVNYIDNEIFGKMETDGIAPSAISSDEEFFRRVNLDLAGQIP